MLSAAFEVWQGRFITQQNVDAYATRYHTMQVLDRMLLTWRLALRERLKTAKSARKAHNTLALRRAWCVWRSQLERSRREALLKTFEARRLKNIFLGIISFLITFQALTGLFKSGCSARNGRENVGILSKLFERWLPRSNKYFLHTFRILISKQSESYGMLSVVGRQLLSMSSCES